MTVLCLMASPSKETSISRATAFELLAALRKRDPEAEVVFRDLSDEPPPHWGIEQVQAAFTPAPERTPAQRRALGLSDALCGELKAADVVVAATPMWNFGVPSTLKAWIDHIVRVGVTFRYDTTGSVGLLGNLRTVYIVEASGGFYSQPASRALNHAAPYLEQIFRFIGAREIVTISAAGAAMDREEALNAARGQIERLETEPGGTDRCSLIH